MYHYITFLGHPSDSTAAALAVAVQYHYITFLGHPSDLALLFNGCAAKYHYITFLGHPSDTKQNYMSMLKSTITLHFWGILPTERMRKMPLSIGVPLHYISGASFRHKTKLYEHVEKYHYITFLGHPSDAHPEVSDDLGVPLHYISGASFRPPQSSQQKTQKYHYITFLGHPSDRYFLWVGWEGVVPLHYISGASFRHCSHITLSDMISTITLHFWGILPTPFDYEIKMLSSTITLHFWGILPTPLTFLRT